MCTNKTKVCVCVSCHIPVTRIMFVGTSAHPTNMGRNMNKRIRRSRKVLSFWNVNVKMAARQEFRGEDSFDRNIKTSILFLRPWSCTHTTPHTIINLACQTGERAVEAYRTVDGPRGGGRRWWWHQHSLISIRRTITFVRWVRWWCPCSALA